MTSIVNDITAKLAPYPMEELAKIRTRLVQKGVKVYDFGTGDPRIPTWEKITQTLRDSVPKISQYPTARGIPDLLAAHKNYLKTRFGLDTTKLETCATAGSKESIFHVTLSIIGRADGKKTIVYPDPGYPVYYSSTIFAGGKPYAVRLKEESDYLLEPWKLPKDVQSQAAAIWANYPHNPTGACAPRTYWEKLVEWCHTNDCLLLSDDCYVDIYDQSIDERGDLDARPFCPLQLSTDRVLSFMSLSKRSGLTGFRSGMIAGDSAFITKHVGVRANIGVASPPFVQQAAVVAWNDEAHVAERRKIFTHRMQLAGERFMAMGMLDKIPPATFYLWCTLPKNFPGDDVQFTTQLSEKGVIASPSQWLSEGMSGYVRFALVPEEKEMLEALDIVANFVKEYQ